MVCEQSATSDGALVADLYVRGVWIPQAEALFDIRVQTLILSLTMTTLPWLSLVLQSMIKVEIFIGLLRP